MKKSLIVLVLVSALLVLSGCVKPYQKEKFVEIEPNQSAFVVPLEGDTADQGKFESVDYLKDKQVATKRVKVPTRWRKTGRLYWHGEYIDTVRVIVVDRYPETREWQGEQSFVGESKDSIKFNQGVSATAQILEEDSSTFLYQYSGKTLKDVMDKEIRNKIGSVLLEKYSTLTIEEIRADKGAVLEHVRKEVEPYFKDRGITVTNLGYIGDLKYLDDAIQEAINKKFNAQEEQKAQEIINKTEVEKAEAEAEANKIRKDSMKEILEIKELELREQWIEKWNGDVPSVMTGESSDLLLNIPRE